MSKTTYSVEEMALQLLGRAPTRTEPIARSGNNRVFRVDFADQTVLMKQYPRSSSDVRDRQGTETTALSFLTRHGIARVPRVLAADTQSGWSALSWIEGTRIGAATQADLMQLVEFAGILKDLSRKHDAAALPTASEACLSLVDLVCQVDMRLSRLAAQTNEQSLRPVLARARELLDTHLGRVISDAGVAGAAAGTMDEIAAGPGFRTLSPSDFGFHNALRQADGQLAFVDFEYFGWDDPVKLAADVHWHPGMALSGNERAGLETAFAALFGDDPQWAHRYRICLPLYGLRWCGIVLNEFLPDRWLRRALAGDADSWESAKQRQLGKALALLDEVADLVV